MSKEKDPTEGIDELKEFVNELPLANSVKNQLAEMICRELLYAIQLGRNKGFGEAMNLRQDEFEECLEKAAKEVKETIDKRMNGFMTPSAN